MKVFIRLSLSILFGILSLSWLGSSLIAQESAPPKATILESRVSTTTPVEGETLRYFLKFDYAEDSMVYPVHHFDDYGFTVIETRSLEPQVFTGRVIQQYEYTLTAPGVGEFDFSPVTLQYPGPVNNPVAVEADPIQVTVVPVVDVTIQSNSPIMLHDQLTVQVVITQRQPVTITALPHEFQAEFQIATPPTTVETDALGTPTPPPLPPPALQFKLGDSPDITSEEVEGRTIDSYTFDTLVEPRQPGVYVIPPFAVGYRTANGEERNTLTPEDTKIFVLHPNTDNLAVKTDYRFLIAPAIVIAALLLVGTGLFMVWRVRKKRREATISVLPPLPPAVVARKELANIRAMDLPTRGEFKAYYSLVSEAVRKFLGAEFGFHVLERTTREVMQDIQQRDVPQTIVDKTARFLREADMVKFAKYIPLLEETDDAMQHALQLVDESVEYHQRHIEQAVPEVSDDQISGLKVEAG